MLMQDIEEGFIKGPIRTVHFIFITIVVKYGKIEQLERITRGRKKKLCTHC